MKLQERNIFKPDETSGMTIWANSNVNEYTLKRKKNNEMSLL